MSVSFVESYISQNLIEKGFSKPEALFNSIVVSTYYEQLSKLNNIDVDEMLSIIELPKFNRDALNVETNPNFLKWAETDEIIESYDVKDTDFSKTKPYIIKAYHGTSHSLESFEALKYGNKEGHFGAVNYFTTDFFDAKDNYSGEGPDMGVKIDKLAEELMNDDDFIEEFCNDTEDHRETAERVAKERLMGQNNQVIEVFIKTKKPFIISENQNIFVEFVDFEKIEQEAIERLIDNNGITLEEYGNDEDSYSDELDEIRWEIHDETENPLIQAINDVACYWDLDPSAVLSDVNEFGYEGTSMLNLEQTLRKNESIQMHEDYDTNEYMAGHLISDIIKRLGYDSIILVNPEKRFATMNIDPNAVHIHVFDEFKSHIKSIHNFGKFDIDDPRILYQSAIIDGQLINNDTRGSITYISGGRSLIEFTENSDESTFIHEIGHHFLMGIKQLAAFNKKFSIEQLETIYDWWKENSFDIAEEASKYSGREIIKTDVIDFLSKKSNSMSREKYNSISTACDEYFARGVERYFLDKETRSSKIASVFEVIKSWLKKVYSRSDELNVSLNDKMVSLFDDMFTSKNVDVFLSDEKLKDKLHALVDINISNSERRGIVDNLMSRGSQEKTRPDSDLKVAKTPGGNFLISLYQDGKLNNLEDIPAVISVNSMGELIGTHQFINGKKYNIDPENTNSLNM